MVGRGFENQEPWLWINSECVEAHDTFKGIQKESMLRTLFR